jgi:hypothetical protein
VYMTGASIYVTAVISASAAILGASITPLTTIYQNARYARRDQQLQHETAVRTECIKLLHAVWDLRTMVANNHEYHGDEMGARLAKVRRRAADASMKWVIIATLAPSDLGGSARRLGMAADLLAVEAAKYTDLDRGRSIRAPEFGEVDSCIKDFSARVVAYFGG